MGADGASTLILLIVLLLAKHYVCDFLLQTPFQIRNKGTYGHPGGLLHAAIHALFTGVILFFFPVGAGLLVGLVLAEFVVHYHIDWAKEQISRRLSQGEGSGFWALFGFDQLLHQLTYVSIAATA